MATEEIPGFMTVDDTQKRDERAIIVHYNQGKNCAPDILFPNARGIEMLNDLGEWRYYNIYDIRDLMKFERGIRKVTGGE